MCIRARSSTLRLRRDCPRGSRNFFRCRRPALAGSHADAGLELPRLGADIGLRGYPLPRLAADLQVPEKREARSRYSTVSQGPLDDTTRETIQSLCDLARLAVEHGQLYEQVVHRSQFDRLTGLPNRLLLEDRLRQAMVIASGRAPCLEFVASTWIASNQINDSLGLDLGDAFFKLVSERLNLSIGTLTRLLATVAMSSSSPCATSRETSDATKICHRLLKDLSAPFLLHGRSLTLTASIGISIFPDHGDSTDLLLRNADIALHAAKRAGGGGVQLYSTALGRQTRRAEEMVGALRQRSRAESVPHGLPTHLHPGRRDCRL